ncbi:MAG: hypothetical protein ABEJ31_11875 [Haloarculaceae archaeon]
MLDPSADAETALYWFGRTALDADGDAAAIPSAVAEFGLLEPGARVFWAPDPAVPAAFLSHHEDLFEDDGGVLLAGSDDLDRELDLAVPSVLLETGGLADGPADAPVLEAGTSVHFLTTPDLLDAGACMVATDAVVRELFADRIDAA